MLDCTSSFLGKLKEFCFKPTDILISFDVVSLFTNVPLAQTIDKIADHIYELDSRPTFDKKTFKKLMHMATSGIFMYRERYYQQIDGVTMGSPLGPELAFVGIFCNRFNNNVACMTTCYLCTTTQITHAYIMVSQVALIYTTLICGLTK